MLEKMKPIIAEQLNVNEAEIKPETIEIPSEDLEKIVTVNDIIGYLKEKGVEA